MVKLNIVICFVALISFNLYECKHDDSEGPASDGCVRCIEQGSTCRDTHRQCSNDLLVCGSFNMTKSYWLDGGGLIADGDTEDDPQAWEICATNEVCAKKTVEGYIEKYPKIDCDGDGYVTCMDFALLHSLGPDRCTIEPGHRSDEETGFVERFERCFRAKKPCTIPDCRLTCSKGEMCAGVKCQGE